MARRYFQFLDWIMVFCLLGLLSQLLFILFVSSDLVIFINLFRSSFSIGNKNFVRCGVCEFLIVYCFFVHDENRVGLRVLFSKNLFRFEVKRKMP